MVWKRKMFEAGWIIETVFNSGLRKKKLDFEQEKERAWIRG